MRATTPYRSHRHEIGGGALAARRNAAPAYDMPWHAHDCGMLLIPLTGRFKVSDELREGLPVLPGLFVWTPQALGHQTVAQSASQSHLALYLDSDFFDATLAANCVPVSPSLAGVRHASKVMIHHANALNQLLTTKGSAADAIATCGGALMQEAARLIGEQGAVAGALQLGRANAVMEACEILQASLRQPPALNALAERLNLSARHLQRLFKAETGLTMEQYLLAQRIARAKAFLRNTHLPVADVANEVGWESASYLALKFREYVGMSPTTYRGKTAG